jgi:hypothetical protein
MLLVSWKSVKGYDISCQDHTAPLLDIRSMNMEHWWNDPERGGTEELGEKLLSVRLCLK